MKKTINLSLAVIAMTTSVFATDVKTDFKGDIKTIYHTSNANDGSLLDKDSSMANVGISIGADFSIGDDTNAGINAVYLDTAGLEGSITNGGLQSSGDGMAALTEAYIAKRFGDTGVIIGRQAMQTPMLFTEENRNVLYGNTFNAVTAMNKSIEGVTLIGSVVGGSNDSMDLSTFDKDNMGGTTYVAGILTQPMTDVKANVWYYNTESQSNTIWADADINTFYSSVLSLQGAVTTMADDATTEMYGVRVKTEVEGIKLAAAYNSVNQEVGSISMANKATGATSSLFTQMYMVTDMVAGTAGDTVDSVKLCAHKAIDGVDYKVAYGTNFDDSEYNLIANTKFGQMDVDAVLGAYDNSVAAETSAFATIRASYKF